MREVKLPVGVRDGEFILISEIKESERGAACRCKCPKCGEFLIAKIGEKNIHHFAHFRSECSLSSESALHMYAKDVLKYEKKLRLPGYSMSYNTSFLKKENFEYGGWECNKTVFNDILFEFDECVVEKSFEGIRVDIALRKGDKWLIVEFGVTHFINEEKYEKLKKLNISCLEISFDLKKFSKYNFDKDVIKNFIIESTENKEWIYNVRINKEIEKIIEKNKEIVILKNEKLKRDEELELKRKENIEYQEEQKIKRILKKKIKYEQNIKRNTEQKSIWWEHFLKINKVNSKSIPKYLNVKIENNFVFDCENKVWQSIIVQKFVFEKKIEESVKLTEINKWMYSQKKVRELKVDKDLRFMNEVYGNLAIKGFNDVVKEYLEVLETYGFIKIYKYSGSQKGVFLTFRVYKNKIDMAKEMFLERDEIEESEREMYNRKMECFNQVSISNYDEYIENESKQSTFINKNKLNKTKLKDSDFRTCKFCGEHTREWSVAGNKEIGICTRCYRKSEF